MDKKINFIFDHPQKTLLTIYYRKDDERDLSILGLKKEKKVKVVTNTPAAINGLKEFNIPSELLFNLNSIVRMLVLKRIDVLVASNLAIEKMDEFKSGKIVRGEMVKTLDHGIGCSIGTSSEVVSRLKAAAKNWQLELK